MHIKYDHIRNKRYKSRGKYSKSSRLFIKWLKKYQWYLLNQTKT